MINREDDTRQKVMGLNPGAGKRIFSCNVSVKEDFYDHLPAEFLHYISDYLMY